MKDKKNSKSVGANYKRVRLIVLILFSNIIFFLLFANNSDKAPEVPRIDLSQAFAIRAKLNIDPDYLGEIAIFDKSRNIIINGFNLLKSVDGESIIWSPSNKRLQNFWKREFVILPKDTTTASIKRRRYDQSF
jgi:hypothetical protein